MADPQYVIQSLSYPLGGVPIIAHLRVRPMSELTSDDFVLAFPIGASAEFTNARVMRVSEINLIDFGPVEEIVTGELTHLATFSGYADLNSPRDLVIIGDILYVGTATSDSVASFNISDPLHIALLDSFTDSELNMTLGLHRITDDILLAGSAISNNLLTLDVSDPSNITKIASIHDSSAFSPTGDSGVHNGHAFVLASNNRLITSVDVSNPSSLSITQSLYDEVCYLTSPPVFSGDVMFFTANTTHNLVAYDISDPANMTEISRIVMPDNYPNYVALSGSYAFVVTGYSGNFYTVDISDPANMSIVGGITDVVAGQTKVWVFGDIAYTCDNVGAIRSVDISDPENPTVAYQRLQDTDVIYGPEKAAKSGVNLFMTGAYGNQVAVFSTTSAPELLDVAVAVATKGSSVKCEDMRYFGELTLPAFTSGEIEVVDYLPADMKSYASDIDRSFSFQTPEFEAALPANPSDIRGSQLDIYTQVADPGNDVVHNFFVDTSWFLGGADWPSAEFIESLGDGKEHYRVSDWLGDDLTVDMGLSFYISTTAGSGVKIYSMILSMVRDPDTAGSGSAYTDFSDTIQNGSGPAGPDN